MEDIDLNLDDFIARVNSDLVGKYVNIASRAPASWPSASTASLSADAGHRWRVAEAAARRAPPSHAGAYEAASSARRCARSWRWPTPSTSTSTPQALGTGQAGRQGRRTARRACSSCIEAFRLLTLYLKPVLPALARQGRGLPAGRAADLGRRGTPLGAHAIGAYQHLMQRVDPKQVDALSKPPKPPAGPAEQAPTVGASAACPPTGGWVRLGAARGEDRHISIDDFIKVDLRIAEDRQRRAGSKAATKLLRLTLDAGEGRAQCVLRHRRAYEPEHSSAS
jgi:methionyl-tRNA synthetase